MISVVILTKNEEKNIERCLESMSFCDEIIVVDDYSTDNTQNKISNIKNKKDKLNIKIFERKLNNDFSGQRNFGMEKAEGEWILFIDSDEVVTMELKREIEQLFNKNFQFSIFNFQKDITAFYIKRRDFFWGRELMFGETGKARNQGLIRLVRKNSGKWVGRVHEKFKIKNSELRIESLNGYLNHYPHQTVKEFIEKVNFYSTLRAKELFSRKIKANIFEIIFYPLGKFILTYFIKLGFLDGPAGFAYSFFMSFHSFLVRAKLYQYYFQTQNSNGRLELPIRLMV